MFDDQVGPDGLACIRKWDHGRGLEYGVLLHSPLLQMDVSNELDDTIALLDDRGDGRALDFIVCTDRETARMVRSARPGTRVEWLPHCIAGHDDLLAQPERSRPPTPPICWLPLTLQDRDPYYRHKNTSCQLAAVKLAAVSSDRRVRVVTSYASDSMRRLAACLELPLQETGSMNPDQLRAFRRTVGVGLCASLSESFSYSAAELMLQGIPTLFGPALEWAWKSRELVAVCGTEHPGSIERLAGQLERLLSDGSAYGDASRLAKRTAEAAVLRNHGAAVEVIRALAAPDERITSV
jgi:hypothetical protein